MFPMSFFILINVDRGGYTFFLLCLVLAAFFFPLLRPDGRGPRESSTGLGSALTTWTEAAGMSFFCQRAFLGEPVSLMRW